MGLFSFIGKAAKAVGGLIGGPVGGALKFGGGLLDHKSGGPSGAKVNAIGRLPPMIIRAKAPMPTSSTTVRPGGVSGSYYPRQVFSSTPTMPGGAVATPSGVVPAVSPTPPMQYAGSGTRTKRSAPRRKKASSRKTTKRKTKLKFGSPAWRKKYMKKKR